MSDLPNLANRDYVARVNRAIDYITANLAAPLSLDEVSRAACFSPYHFHRIFRAVMGETLAAFVKRVRLERAVYLLSHRRGASLTEIALACGFTSNSDFSRSFRAHYGVSPRGFDLDAYRRSGRQALEKATPGLANTTTTGSVGTHLEGFTVTIRDLPTRRVAYLRVHHPYEGDHVPRAIDRLIAWADSRGLADGQWLGYQWDDPDIVPLEKCRYDVGLEVPTHVQRDGDVGVCEFAATRIAEIAIKGGIELELRALDWLYREWLPGSGYAPAHMPGFEAWDGRPFAHGTEHFEFRIQLPIVDAHQPL